MAESILSDEIRERALALEVSPTHLTIERGHVQRFAEAIGDGNPLWNDEREARRTPWGGMLAPPTFLRALAIERVDSHLNLPLNRVLDGGSEWEYFEPIRVGDTITATPRIVDMRERKGRLGSMVFLSTLVTYTNQYGDKVASQRVNMIRY